MNLGNLLTASALRNPHKPALIFQEESASDEQLDATTTSLAQALLAQGCQPGDRIALHWQHSNRYIADLSRRDALRASLSLVPREPRAAPAGAASYAAACGGSDARYVVRKRSLPRRRTDDDVGTRLEWTVALRADRRR